MLTFNSIKELKSYTAAVPERITEESLATVDNVVYKYINGSWAPLKVNSSEGLTMSLYDFNKMTLEGLPVLSAADAKNDLEIVALLYRILQTDAGERIAANGKKWVELSSLENIANFLTAYIAV